MSDLNPFIVDHIAPGVLKERSANGVLVIFAIANGHESTVAAWAEAVQETLKRWPAHQPCYLLHDLHKSGQTAFNAHMRADFKSLYTLRGDIEQYVAFVMPEHSMDAARLDTELLSLKADRSTEHLIHWAIFSDRQEALHWLSEHMPDENRRSR